MFLLMVLLERKNNISFNKPNWTHHHKRNLADFSAMRDLDLLEVEKAMKSVKLLKKLRVVEVAIKHDIDVIIHTKDEEIAELKKK